MKYGLSFMVESAMKNRVRLYIWLIVAVGARFAYGLEIAGQVVDNKARPVEGAEVAVYEQYSIGGFEDHGKLTSPIVETDSKGRFQFQANVSVQKNAFVVARKSGLALAWDRLNRSEFALGKGLFSLVLEPPCTLAGRLVDPNGKPVPDARVQALPVTSYLDRLAQRPILAPKEWFTTTTDSQGRFRFEQFAADVSATFRVSVPGSPGTNVFRTQQMAACGFEVWRSDIRLALPREGTIKGRVVDNRGQPVGGVDLLIRAAGNPEYTGLYLARRAQSTRDGTFVIRNIPEGPHQIHVVPPEQGLEQWVGKFVNVLLKPAETVGDATIQVTQGGILEVTVLDNHTKRPLSNVKVNVSGQEWGRSSPALTDAKGVARSMVPAGQFSLDVTSDGFHAWRNTEQAAEGQTLMYQALLVPRPEFPGRVLDSANRPVTDAAVTLHPAGDQVYTDDKGRFAGHWDEQRGARGGIVVARNIRDGLAATVPIADWSKPADLRLVPAWTLTGKIVDPNGVGIPAARVALGFTSHNCLGDLGVEVLTDAKGCFEMKAIPRMRTSFRYSLSVNAAGYGSKGNSWISPSGSPGTAVDVGVIQLPPADVSLSGVVVDAGGTPVAHVCVTAATLEGLPPSYKRTATNEKGEFSFRGLCQGPIRLQAGFANVPGGAGSIRTELPTQSVKIVMKQDIRTTGEVVLLGKPLPSLADLSARLSPAQVDSKPVLMCFLDLEQRPSRQCLSELAGKAGVLATQGVSLLVVQTSKVDMKQYEMWLKENRITVPIHAASADFETKRRAWGVMSLPWLILTDKNHVVRAEGFTLDDLDRKVAGLE
jgi:protocatechuate 3,4-dioxygenase beta subunit